MNRTEVLLSSFLAVYPELVEGHSCTFCSQFGNKIESQRHRVTKEHGIVSVFLREHRAIVV